MIKKSLSIILCIALIFSFSLIFYGCEKPITGEFPVTIGDTTIKAEPKNVVVLSDNFADIISYIGYDVKFVGRSADIDQEFLSVVPSVGTKENPSIDLITEFQTDLIITNNTLSDNSKQQITEKGIPVLQLQDATTMDELKTLYTNLGTALGGEKTGKTKGEDAYNDLIDTLDSFKNSVSRSIIKTACYLYLNENGELCTFTKDSIESQLFSYCSVTNIFADQESPVVDIDKLRLATPSYIFYSDEFTLQAITKNEDLKNMSAIKNNNLAEIPFKNFKRQGVTYQDTVYKIMDLVFIQSKASKDEETTMSTTVTQAPSTNKETTAPETE